jgi:hypothetical protein
MVERQSENDIFTNGSKFIFLAWSSNVELQAWDLETVQFCVIHPKEYSRSVFFQWRKPSSLAVMVSASLTNGRDRAARAGVPPLRPDSKMASLLRLLRTRPQTPLPETSVKRIHNGSTVFRNAGLLLSVTCAGALIRTNLVDWTVRPLRFSPHFLYFHSPSPLNLSTDISRAI